MDSYPLKERRSDVEASDKPNVWSIYIYTGIMKRLIRQTPGAQPANEAVNPSEVDKLV